MDAVYWRGERERMEKIGSFFEKTALDAMKARQMAQAAGIVPAAGSAWKWALRNMRDGRGDLLQGKAFGDAKFDLGKMPNNMRQKLESVVRHAGGDREVGTIVKKDDPEWNKQLSHGRVDRSLFKKQEEPETNNEEEFDFLKALLQMQHAPKTPVVDGYAIGSHGSVNFEELNDGARLTRSIHTHPYNSFDLVKTKHDVIKAVKDTLTSQYTPDYKQYVADRIVRTYPDEYAKRLVPGAPLVSLSGYAGRKTIPELNKEWRMYYDSLPEDSKSYWSHLSDENGHFAPPAITPDDYARSQQGDYGAFLQYEESNPGMKHNIVDPTFGYEGVHAIRPHGVRSVYFHRTGQ